MDNSMLDKPSAKVPIANTIPIRIRKTTARLLQSYLKKCNYKSHGRRVKADDVIAMAISLLDDSHLEKIQSATYSSQDHLDIEYKKRTCTHCLATRNEREFYSLGQERKDSWCKECRKSVRRKRYLTVDSTIAYRNYLKFHDYIIWDEIRRLSMVESRLEEIINDAKLKKCRDL